MRALVSLALGVPPRARSIWRSLLTAILLTAGCAADWVASDPLPALDEPFFRCNVQPELAKSCAQLACHGDPARYFKIYSRNRLRNSGTPFELNVALRPDEGAANFASARAFADLKKPRESLLLKKALGQDAGGLFHRGAEIFGGGNVFADEDDADYQIILQWIEGATEDAACIEPGSNL